MERYKGKNDIWLILVFVFYNLLPIGIYFLTDDKENLYNNWRLLIWVFYYSFNIIWIPVLIRNRVELYDDYFIFYYGFGKEKIFIKDILKIEKSNNSIASSANSLDRIHLITTQKDFYISLKNNDNFINKIKQRRQV